MIPEGSNIGRRCMSKMITEGSNVGNNETLQFTRVRARIFNEIRKHWSHAWQTRCTGYSTAVPDSIFKSSNQNDVPLRAANDFNFYSNGCARTRVLRHMHRLPMFDPFGIIFNTHRLPMFDPSGIGCIPFSVKSYQLVRLLYKSAALPAQ